MKADVLSLAGVKKSQVDLPKQFSEPVRTDLIKRAVLAMRTNNYQIHATDPRAGLKQGDAMPKRRRKYKGTYGKGISRVMRKVMWHRGLHFAWVGAFISNARKGRKAFPPEAGKIIIEKINVTERRKAIRSAISATANKELVSKRTSLAPEIKSFPFIVEDKIQDLKKTADVKAALGKLGFEKEIARVEERKVRPGKGKMRGRKLRVKVGPLFVVGKKCDLIRAAENIPGVDVATVESLNAELLAPGTVPGRLTIWTESAIERLGKEELFE